MTTITIEEFLANETAYKEVKELKVTGSAPADCTELFSELNGCEVLDVSELDTSNTTNMDYMFNWCFHLKELDITSFDTSKVTTMNGMFSNCWDLKTIRGLEKFDITNLTSAKYMFNECQNLENFDASKLEAADINKKHMFRKCNGR